MVTTTVALGVTVAVLVAFAGLGTWYARGKVDSVESYVSARNTAGPGTLTATLIASGMGAWILLSPAEAGAAFGGLSAVLGYAVGSAVPMVAYVFLGPRIRDLIPNGHTLTEYAYVRYGAATYALVLVVSVSYMFVFLAAEMTGIAGALSLVAGVPPWQTAGLIGFFVLLYTGYGGLQASIFTDVVQTVLLLPLLAVGFVGAVLALGGTRTIYDSVAATDPALLDPGFLPGLRFGVYVVIAILAAEMVNQSWWQRIYAARDDRTLRRSFAVTAVVVVPMLFLAGLFGVAATGLGLVGDGNASVAFFLVVNEAFPEWVTLVVVLVALLLVVSTADTLFNAIASTVTADLPRLLDGPCRGLLLGAARALTAVVAVAAAFVGAMQYSVLTLFLVADLLAAATFVPLLAGLYTRRLTGGGALAACVAGLGVGAAFFPPFGVLPQGSFLLAFVGAAGVSTLVVAVATAASGADFEYETLERDIRRLDEPVADGGEEEP